MRQNIIGLGHQNFMLAVRREMGWPTFKPAKDCIAFCSGRRISRSRRRFRASPR